MRTSQAHAIAARIRRVLHLPRTAVVGAAGPPRLGRVLTATLGAAGLLLGMSLVAIPTATAAAGLGSISGTVTGPLGAHLADVRVYAVADSGTTYSSDWTAGDGSYTLEDVPAGAYRLAFRGPTLSGLADEYSGNSYTWADAEVITVAPAGWVVTGVDAELALGGTISGVVTDPEGAPVGGASVARYLGLPGQMGDVSTSTAADGSYTLRGLTPGASPLSVVPAFGSGLLDLDVPSPIDVTLGSVHANTSLSLLRGASITGTVTDADGAPVEGVGVSVHLPGATLQDANTSAWSTTGVDGTFTVVGMVTGGFTVRFSPPSGSALVASYYGGSTTEEDATRVPLTQGAVTGGIDATLQIGGSISGRVIDEAGVPIADAVVSAGDGDWQDVASDGTYRIVGLEAGTYDVSANVPVDDTEFLSRDILGVSVTLGQESQVADLILPRGGAITGVVTGPGGTPLSGVEVRVWGAGMFIVSDGEAVTAADGSYRVRALESGDYLVKFDPGSQEHASEFYVDSTTEAGASRVSVERGHTVAGINAQLEVGALAAVSLFDENGAAAWGVTVELLANTGPGRGTPIASSDHSDELGLVDLTNLRSGTPGRLLVGRGSADTPFVAQYYRSSGVSASTFEDASVVTPVAGSPLALSMTLRTGAQITGVVRNADGSAVAYQWVVAFVDDGSLASRSALTGADGSYTIRGLLPGSYQVAAARAGINDSDVFYGSGKKPAAPNVVVTGTGTTSGVDITVGTRFTDVAPTYPFFSYISWLADRGISTGWVLADGSAEFRPLQPVTREAMAAFLYRDIAVPGFVPPVVSPFTDVPTTYPFYSYVSWLAGQGISTGWVMGDGTKQFRPTEAVSREAMAAFLYRAAGSPAFTAPAVSPFTDVATSYPFYKQISWLAANNISTGWVMGDGTKQFRPLQPVTREAMAAFLQRADTLLNPGG